MTTTIKVLSRTALDTAEKAKIMTWFETHHSGGFKVSFVAMSGPFFGFGLISVDGLNRGRGTKLAKKAAERFYDLLNA